MRIQRIICVIGLVFLFLLNASPGVAASQSSSSAKASKADVKRTVLVLDASGSMWGQIHGKAKIERVVLHHAGADVGQGAHTVMAQMAADCADQYLKGKRDFPQKVPVAVALELNDEGKPKRVAMSSVKRVTGHHLKRFAADGLSA